MIDPRHLRALREVAARGSVTAAARALGYSVSALSQQLAALQSEVGANLLERHGRTVRLTTAGETLAGHADDVLASIEAAEAAVQAVTDELGGPLRVAAFATAIRHVVAPALSQIRKDHPLLDLRLVMQEPHDSLPNLRAGRLEVAIAHEYSLLPALGHEGIDRMELVEESMLLALPPGSSNGDGAVELGKLRDARWVASPVDTTCGRAVRRACQAAGFEPDVRFIADDFGATLALVAAGAAVALVPRLGLDGRFDVDVRQPVDPTPVRRIFAATRRGSQTRPAIAAVLRAVTQTATTALSGKRQEH